MKIGEGHLTQNNANNDILLSCMFHKLFPVSKWGEAPIISILITSCANPYPIDVPQMPSGNLASTDSFTDGGLSYSQN